MIAYSDPWLTILEGDALEQLRTLPDESVQCCITSPPFFGLRSYLPADASEKSREMGSEATPEDHIAALVAVFREVRRVLRRDGTLWLEYGDAYGTGAFTRQGKPRNVPQAPNGYAGEDWTADRSGADSAHTVDYGPTIKPKDLLMMPARVALALQADGWWLRSDIIWARPNPMPESVTDRPTKSYSHVFLLTKAPRYYCDMEAIREPGTTTRPELLEFGPRPDVDYPGHSNDRRRSKKPDGWDTGPGGHGTIHRDGREAGELSEIRGGRNARDVWTIPTEAYPGLHFATFPRELVRRCLLAGTSERGACPECGAPWGRVTKITYGPDGKHGPGSIVGSRNVKPEPNSETVGRYNKSDVHDQPRLAKSTETTGWRPTCDCVDEVRGEDGEYSAPQTKTPIPCVCLDPFFGSGTVGLVAERYGRRTIGIELNPEYIDQAKERVARGRREGTGAALDMELKPTSGSLWESA